MAFYSWIGLLDCLLVLGNCGGCYPHRVDRRRMFVAVPPDTLMAARTGELMVNATQHIPGETWKYHGSSDSRFYGGFRDGIY